jgi:hypothetical protein
LETPPAQSHKRRQKSFGVDSPEVVTTGQYIRLQAPKTPVSHCPCCTLADQIRPDWEAKLTAIRAAVTRRANRRIIMRQVGDRLIPVGVSSGRVHAISEDATPAENNDNGGSTNRRSRRRQQAAQNQDLNQLLGSMGLGGQDLEEAS